RGRLGARSCAGARAKTRGAGSGGLKGLRAMLTRRTGSCVQIQVRPDQRRCSAALVPGPSPGGRRVLSSVSLRERGACLLSPRGQRVPVFRLLEGKGRLSSLSLWKRGACLLSPRGTRAPVFPLPLGEGPRVRAAIV